MTHHTMADHVLWLRHIQPQHRHLIGENAYQLGMALQKGYPVLPGIILSTVFFEEFLESVDWIDPLLADLPHSSLHLDVDNPHQLQTIAQRIQQSVAAQAIAPEHQTTIFSAVQSLEAPLVTIRPLLVLRQNVSSPSTPSTRTLSTLAATALPHHLLAGQICRNDHTDLMMAIQQVWTRFFQASHLFYWQRLGLPFHYLQLALLIQPAVSSIASGTVHVTKDFVDISASWGVVHGMQIGDIIPDRYYTYEDSQVTHQHIGSKRYAYALHLPRSHSQGLPSNQVVSDPTSAPVATPTPLSWHQQDGATFSPDPLTDYLHRYALSDQEAQQGILPSKVLARIRQLSHDLRKMVGTALCIEWSIHALPPEATSPEATSPEATSPEAISPEATSPETTSFGSTLPWDDLVAQEGLHHQESPHRLKQARYVLQVTYLFPQRLKGHITASPDPALAPPVPPTISTPKPVAPDSVASTPAGSPDLDTSVASLLHSQNAAPTSTSIIKGSGASGGTVIAPVLVAQDVNQLAEAGSVDRYIIVTRNITFSWFNAIRTVQGLVSEQGGMTSHGAILAREVGIPAVVGVAGASAVLKTGDWVILDGDRGTITPIPPPPDSTAAFPALSALELEESPDGAPENDPGGKTNQGRTNAFTLDTLTPTTQLMLSLSQTDQLDTLAQLPVNGVGLIRSELMITSMLQHQSLQQWLQPDQRPRFLQTLVALIQQFAQAFAPRPIWYRTLDLRSHEYPQLSSMQALPEANPLLGYHGPMSYQLDSTLFLAELNALKQVQDHGFDNVNILLPFVRTVEEFQFCHEAIQQIGWLDQGSGQVWIMAEVPSVLFLLPDYVAAGVQGIAIGSNDLAHLMLAIDRTNPNQGIGPTHPAVLRAIQTLIGTARHANIPCTLCGDLASQHPEWVESFIRWGITAFSVEPNAVEPIQASIRQAEWRLFQQWQRDRFSSHE